MSEKSKWGVERVLFMVAFVALVSWFLWTYHRNSTRYRTLNASLSEAEILQIMGQPDNKFQGPIEGWGIPLGEKLLCWNIAYNREGCAQFGSDGRVVGFPHLVSGHRRPDK